MSITGIPSGPILTAELIQNAIDFIKKQGLVDRPSYVGSERDIRTHENKYIQFCLNNNLDIPDYLKE